MEAVIIPTPALVRAIRLRPEAAVAIEPGGTGVLSLNGNAVRLPNLPLGSGAVLDLLTCGDLPEPAAQRRVDELDGLAGVVRWQALLGRLDRIGLIERSVLVDGAVVARLRHLVPGRSADVVRHAGPVRLSRFATVRAASGTLTLERADGNSVVDLSPAVAGVLGRLAGWATDFDDIPGVPPDLARAVADLIARAGLLASGGPDTDPETTDPALAQWTPADLWLHSVSRSPKRTPGYGGSYPLSDLEAPPLPAIPPLRSGELIALPVPDLARVAAADPPLTTVLEQRRSVRTHNDVAPITIDQLAELLYRCVRVRRTFNDGNQDLLDRPFPAGGSVHELEIYPLVTRCAGLAPGLYHYAAADHRLEPVAEPGPATTALVAAARSAGVMESDPQVVLIVSARFGRVMWKYHAIGYSLILKHVGVLYQTIYLVATAMGLAVCGLGAGDAADFATASGLPYHEEGSVGELLIGGMP